MKRYTRLGALLLLVVVLLAACGGPAPSAPLSGASPSVISGTSGANANAQVALLWTEEQPQTRLGADLLAALTWFGGEEGVAVVPYVTTPEEAPPTLELALKGGAQLVVLMGDGMADVLEAAQLKYPAVNFLLAEPEREVKLAANSATLRLATEQAGWLAGYAAVMDERYNLAFLQPDDLRSARFGIGFVLGAEAAAKQLSPSPGGVLVRLLNGEQDVQGRMAGFDTAVRAAYESGTDVVFANREDVQADIQSYAHSEGHWYIGTIGGGEVVPGMLVATKESFQNVAYTLMKDWKEGNFPGGKALVGDVEQGGVGLLVETAQFEHARGAWYEDALRMLKTDYAIRNQLQSAAQPTDGNEWPSFEKLELWMVRLELPYIDDGGTPASELPQSAAA